MAGCSTRQLNSCLMGLYLPETTSFCPVQLFLRLNFLDWGVTLLGFRVVWSSLFLCIIRSFTSLVWEYDTYCMNCNQASKSLPRSDRLHFNSEQREWKVKSSWYVPGSYQCGGKGKPAASGHKRSTTRSNQTSPRSPGSFRN